MVNAVIMHMIDNVVTVTKKISAGDAITYILNGKTSTIKATLDIPINHKVAIKSLKEGDIVYKYGECIGYTTSDVNVGDHVHTNNLNS